MRAGERGRLFTVAHLWGGGRGGLSTQVLLLSRTVTQGASGLAGMLAALIASLRLGFRRNSEVFLVFRVRELAGRSGSSSKTPPLRNSATQRNSKDTTNARGNGKHAMLFHQQGGYALPFLPVSLLPPSSFQLPASCADACLTAARSRGHHTYGMTPR